MCRLCSLCCVAACPTEASYITEEGVVLIDYDKCIGCGACVGACPYGARTLVSDQPFAFGDDPLPCEEQQAELGNIVEKCTFCAQYVKEGELPACVRACPGKARIFGDLDDPNSEISKLVREKQVHRLLEQHGTQPKVYYISSSKVKNIGEETK